MVNRPKLIETVSLLVLLLTAGFAAPLAQSDEADTRIKLGGIDLRLGMPQDDVLRKLGLMYDVRDSSGGWMIYRRGGPPFELIGNISFTNERLSFVSRHREPHQQEARSLAVDLHNAVNTAAPGGRTCTVSTESFGDGLVSTVIQCGRRRISVFGSTDSKVAATISESVK